MSSDYAQTITDYLAADATLQTLLPGGVRNYAVMGRKGLNRIQQSDAYDPKIGIVKPLCIVLALNEEPTYEGIDLTNGYMTTITPILTWLYQDGDSGYTVVNAAFNRIYSILQGHRFLNPTFRVLFKSVIKDKREPDLSDASFYRADWRVHGSRSAASS